MLRSSRRTCETRLLNCLPRLTSADPPAVISHLLSCLSKCMHCSALSHHFEADGGCGTVEAERECVADDDLAGTSSCRSGGNRRKLSAAIALIAAPAVSFLDEPSSGMVRP